MIYIFFFVAIQFYSEYMAFSRIPLCVTVSSKKYAPFASQHKIQTTHKKMMLMMMKTPVFSMAYLKEFYTQYM